VGFAVKWSAESQGEHDARPGDQGPGTHAVALRPGQPFNPYGLFHGIHIPEALVRCKEISPGAKLAYGRLARYAGQDGVCYPRQETLAREIAVCVRQARRYLEELVYQRFLKIIQKGLRAPNEYVFLWHAVFETAVRTDMSAQDRTDMSAQDRTNMSAQDRKRMSAPISRESRQESPVKESPPSSSCGLKAPPPPTPSSPRETKADTRSLKGPDDDDATGPEPKTEYKSEQDELIAVMKKAMGQAPDAKLISDMLDRLKLREMPLRAFIDDVRPRVQRLRRRAGPGFFYSMASEPKRSSPATTEDERAKLIPKRCGQCSGTGKTPSGLYCAECPMGRDLERVENRSARQKGKTGATA